MVGNIYLGTWLQFGLLNPKWQTRIVSHLSNQQKTKEFQFFSKAMQEFQCSKLEWSVKGTCIIASTQKNSDDNENDGELGS